MSGRIVRQPHVDGFVSGLPDMNPLTKGRPVRRPFEEAIADLTNSYRGNRKRRYDAAYNVPGDAGRKARDEKIGQ